MIKFFFIVFFISFLRCEQLYSQNVNYNRIILPKEIAEEDIKEKIVYLAWNNKPQSKILENNISIARSNVQLSKVNWLNNIRVSANINEFVIAPSSDIQRQRAQFWPLYNIGASIALGEFFTNPQLVKISKIEYDNQLQNLYSGKLAVRAEALRAYSNYRLAKEIYKIQLETTEEIFSNYKLVEERFKNGEVLIEEYNQSLKNFNEARVASLKAEQSLDLARINLEEIIGVPLESILE